MSRAVGRREPFCWSDEASGQQYDVDGRERSTHHADAGAVRPSSAAVLPRVHVLRAREEPKPQSHSILSNASLHLLLTV